MSHCGTTSELHHIQKCYRSQKREKMYFKSTTNYFTINTVLLFKLHKLPSYIFFINYVCDNSYIHLTT